MLYKEDWLETREAFEAWWNRSLDRPIIQIFAPKASRWEEPIDGWAFLRYWPHVDEAVSRLSSQFAKTLFMKEAYPNAWINLGPGILSAFLGANLRFDGNVGTAWFEGNKTLDAIKEAEFDGSNPWWKYFVKCAETAREWFRGKAIVGLTDLLDPVTVVGQLRGNFPTAILRDMFTAPQLLKEAIDKIHELWFKYFEEVCKLIDVTENGYSTWAGLWSGRKHYVLQCDIIVYLSPKLFDQFVYPYIVEQSRQFDRSIWHLDGPLELKHLDKLLDIEELDAIQWIPGAGAPDAGDEVWLPLYQKIHEKGKLLQIMVQPQRVMHILKKIPKNEVAIQTTCDSIEQAKRLMAEFESRYQ